LNSEESVAIKTSSFYRDSGVDILSAVDGIRMMLDDNILKAQAMRGSSYIKAFDTEMQTWETKLISMQDILDAWLEVIIMRICTEVDNNL
jgi:dynein heavy chain